jgi:hypothetical protein
MGSAAVFQIAAYGAQDVYLTGDPQVSFFKSVFKRHTNFALEQIEIPITGIVSPGSRVSVTISRYGDLLNGLWVQYNPSKLLPMQTNLYAYASSLSHNLLEQMEIEIGGQVIDRHYSQWLTVWQYLTDHNTFSNGIDPTNKGYMSPAYFRDLSFTKYNTLGITDRPGEIGIGNVHQNTATKYSMMSCNWTRGQSNTWSIFNAAYPGLFPYFDSLGTVLSPNEAYIPMRFWFCCNPGLALPLIALQYHDVKLNITFAPKKSYLVPQEGFPVDDLIVDLSSVRIFGDYIYLDSLERKKFAQEAHEYLIDQVQLQEVDSANATRIELNFNHPVKELIFTGKVKEATNVVGLFTTFPYYFSKALGTYNLPPNLPLTFGPGSIFPLVVTNDNKYGIGWTDMTMKLVLNQNDLFSSKNLKYFTRKQNTEFHPEGSGGPMSDDIGVHSFSLKPFDCQPSGSCNFSRIDNALMIIESRKATETLSPMNIYALNYNILRIMSGMGGLAYSN